MASMEGVPAQIDMDFGSFGQCRGVVQQLENDRIEIVWVCGPDFNGERFPLEVDIDYGADLTGDCPSFFDESVDETVKKFMKEVSSAPEGTKMVNWNEVEEALEEILGEGKYDEDRWRVTMNRLNDPDCAELYPGNFYPTPFALLCLVLAKQFDPSTTLPTIINEENEELYSLADKYTRALSGSRHHRTGYGQLIALERIVAKLRRHGNEDIRNDIGVWREAYLHTQALMLALSDAFESSMWDYDMIDDPERLDKLCLLIVNCFTQVMALENVPDAARQQLEKDKEFNRCHVHQSHIMHHVKYGEWEEDAPEHERAIKKLWDAVGADK